MATRATPADPSATTTESEASENAVHFYRQSVDARRKPTGSFLSAFAKYGDISTLYCQTFDAADYDDFVSRIARLKQQDLECRYVRPGDISAFDHAPVLRIADGAAAPLAWRRRTTGQRRYSIVTEINALGAASVHRNMMEFSTAPVQAWDAMLFPSPSIMTVAEDRINETMSYLASRFNCEPNMPAQRVVIPPGMNVDALNETEDTRMFREGVRRRLGIGNDDMCVLVTGHFAFYERMHPTPLMLALESAARRTGIRIHLLMAGWFDTARIERAYRDLGRDFAPAINVIFLDGRDDEIRSGVWFAGDVYAAFHDSTAHGVDMELLEAMAAGLPIVASDWGANRDFVENTKHGYLIPTYLPLPQSGGDLSLAPEREILQGHDERSDTFLSGTVAQMTAIDIRGAADAFEALARDPQRRKEMGAAARKQIVATCDWSVVIRRHQDLWAELRKLRADSDEIAQPDADATVIPHLDDPFTVFQPFASYVIDEDTMVSLHPGIKNGEGVAERLTRVRANPLNDVAGQVMLSAEEQDIMLRAMADSSGISVIQLAEQISDGRRYRLPRTLAWLAKTGLVVLKPSDAVSPTDAPATGVPPLDLGLAARHQGDDADAAAYFEAVIQDDPADVVSHLQLGEILAEADDLDGAISHFSTATEVDPMSVEAWLDVGKAHVLKGDHASGIAALQKATELSPQSAEAAYLLGAAYRRIGNATDAVKCLEKSIRLQPRHVEALLHLGHARKSMGRRAEALQAFRDALRLAPSSLIARAGELSLGVERQGRTFLERDVTAKRIALHFDEVSGFRTLREVFSQLSDAHWPLLSSDGRDIAEFQPDVIVTSGRNTQRLRAMAPNAVLLSLPGFLSSQNRLPGALNGADAVCAPSSMIAESWMALNLTTADNVYVTGHPMMDGVFRGDQFALPPELRHSGTYVLYAPTGAPGLNSVDGLDDDPLNAVLGPNSDLTLVVKPHPVSIARKEAWITDWARIATGSERLHVILDAEADVLPYLASASAVITDASSVMFEGIALDLPVILIEPSDAPNAVAYDAQGIEWRWREPMTVVTSIQEIPMAVDAALSAPDTHHEARAQYRDALFDRVSGRSAAERVVEVISELST